MTQQDFDKLKDSKLYPSLQLNISAAADIIHTFLLDHESNLPTAVWNRVAELDFDLRRLLHFINHIDN